MNLFQRLTNNLFLKLLSLALAMLLSMYVLRYINPTWNDEFRMDLRVENLSSELIITSPIPMVEGPQIKIKGPINSVRLLEGVNLTAFLDCADVSGPGNWGVQVQMPDFGDLQVVEQSIKEVEVTVEKKATRKLPIDINPVGTQSENFDVGDENLSQTEVEVTGPKSLVDMIDVALIEPLLKEQRDDIRNQVLPIKLYDKNYDLIEAPSLKLQPAQVSYSLRLISTESIEVLQVVPIYTGQLPEDFRLVRHVLEPSRIPVDADDVPEGVFAVRTTPIDLTGVRESFTVETHLIYPFEVPEISRLPDVCEVQVSVTPITEIGGAAMVKVELVGHVEDYDYSILPPEILLRSEELMVMDAAEIDEIRAELFVAGLGPGEYRLSPQLLLPLALERVTIDHDTLQLTIIQRGE